MNDLFLEGSISNPTLLLDEATCKQNIRRMAEKAKRHDLVFRPHFKTHQSLHIGQWFKAVGVDKITVSSLAMAEYFSEGGWEDITVAFPVNLREIERIRKLASAIRLNLLVESVASVEFLSENLDTPVQVFIKIDSGYHRTGILADDTQKLGAVLGAIERSDILNFSGFLTHAGHSYGARSHKEIAEIHASSTGALKRLKDTYQSQFPGLILSIGDTPTCSVMEDFEGIDEIRPGNFVFYDLVQYAIGACQLDDLAVAMACPVVAKHEERQELIVYGGGVHFSKDQLVLKHGAKPIFGAVADHKEGNWIAGDLTRNYVSKLSQEHGTIKVEKEIFDRYDIGSIIVILPVHSCLTANLMKSYLTLEGNEVDRF